MDTFEFKHQNVSCLCSCLAFLVFVSLWRESLTMDGLELPMSTRLDLNLQRFHCSASGVLRSHNSGIHLFCNQDYKDQSGRFKIYVQSRLHVIIA